MNDHFDKLYNRSLRFLSFRPRSKKEIEDFLKKKFSFAKAPASPVSTRPIRGGQRGESEKQEGNNIQSVISSVIKKLTEQNFLNDEEFTKWWIEQRTLYKPRSLRLIKIELKQKGIDDDLIEKISNDEFLISNDFVMAKKLAAKKIKRYKNLPKEEIYQKLGRVLAQKGFNYGTIKAAIDEVLLEVV